MVCSSQLSRFDGYSQLAPVWSNQLAIAACISDPSPKLENVWTCINHWFRKCINWVKPPFCMKMYKNALLAITFSDVFHLLCSKLHWSINSRGRIAVFAMAYVQASNSTLVYSIFKFWTSLNYFEIFRTCILIAHTSKERSSHVFCCLQVGAQPSHEVLAMDCGRSAAA